MRRRQIDAVMSRARGKRGRQADDNGGNMGSLYDTAYWYDQTLQMFRDIADQVLTMAYTASNTPLSIGTANAQRWVNQWAGVLAERWITHMHESMTTFSARQEDMHIESSPTWCGPCGIWRRRARSCRPTRRFWPPLVWLGASPSMQ
jgi:hypothetical protein